MKRVIPHVVELFYRFFFAFRLEVVEIHKEWTSLVLCFAGVRSSGSLTSLTSNGVLNPEIVSSPRIQPQGLEKSSDATDLSPQLGAAPLVPYYKSVLESGSTGFFQERDLKTGDTHRDSSRFRPSDDTGRRNQGVPRTLDVTNVSKVCEILILESNVSARVSRNIIALYFFYVLVFLLHKNRDIATKPQYVILTINRCLQEG